RHIAGRREVLEVCGQKLCIVRGADQVHGSGHDPAAVDAVALDLGDRRLWQVSPAQGVLREEVPASLVLAAQSVWILASLAVRQLLRRSDVMARREVLSRAGHDDYPHVVISSRLR